MKKNFLFASLFIGQLLIAQTYDINMKATVVKKYAGYNKGTTLNNNAHISTKTISDSSSKNSSRTSEEREEAVKKATEYYNKGVKPGSLAAKANMVKQYNEKNNKN